MQSSDTISTKMHPATCKTNFGKMTEPITHYPQNFKWVLIGLPYTLDLRSTTSPIQHSYDPFSSDLSFGKDDLLGRSPQNMISNSHLMTTFWQALHSLFQDIFAQRGCILLSTGSRCSVCVKTCTLQS